MASFHYVYFLRHVEGLLLYVGRSRDPEERLRDFIRREGDLNVVLEEVFEYEDIHVAAAAERELIRAYRPPYNIYVSSSLGAFGKR